MTTVRGITGGSQPVIVSAKQAVVELRIGTENASLPASQARLLAYAILSAAEDAETESKDRTRS
jgi:hypothetical protein